MNERIKELAEQAGLYDEKSPDEVPEFTASFEKFAELLISECYEWAKENGGLGTEYDYNALKEHFGVEEKTIEQDQVPLPKNREQAMAMLRVATFYLDTQK